jgi:hypothetical protein
MSKTTIETEQTFKEMIEAVEKRRERIRAALKATITLPRKLDNPHNHKVLNQMALASCLAEIICDQKEVEDALDAAIDMLEHYVLGDHATVEAEPPQVH